MQNKSERFNLRATSVQANLIQSGAKVRGMNTSQYILETTCHQALQDLADQHSFFISEETMKAFLAALDRPAQEKPRLKKLLNTPSILEK